MTTIINKTFPGDNDNPKFFEGYLKNTDKHGENNNHAHSHHSELSTANIMAQTLDLTDTKCHVNFGLGSSFFPKKSGLITYGEPYSAKYSPRMPQLQQMMRAASEEMCPSFLHSTNSPWAPTVCSALVRTGLHRAGHGLSLENLHLRWHRGERHSGNNVKSIRPRQMYHRRTENEHLSGPSPKAPSSPWTSFELSESLLASEERTNEETINTTTSK